MLPKKGSPKESTSRTGGPLSFDARRARYMPQIWIKMYAAKRRDYLVKNAADDLICPINIYRINYCLLEAREECLLLYGAFRR